MDGEYRISSHVLFVTKAWISSVISLCQWGDLFACLKVVGSIMELVSARKVYGLSDPIWDRDTMEWVRWTMGENDGGASV